MDVSGDRDFALDFLHAAGLTMLHLSRLAEDWILYSGEEYGWLELGDGVTSGSSMMPQKKNPDSLELIRGKCGARVWRLFGAVPDHEGTADDLQSRHAGGQAAVVRRGRSAARVARNGARGGGNYAAEMRRRPRAAVEESWAVATDLADALARSGVPFHQAHKMVGRLVLESMREWKKPADWTAEELAAFDPAFTAEMARYLRPAEGIETREIAGGTGPKAVAAALDEAETRLDRDAMNKSYRQGQILKLIRSRRLHTQEDLARALRAIGDSGHAGDAFARHSRTGIGEDRRRAMRKARRRRPVAPDVEHAGARICAGCSSGAKFVGAAHPAGACQFGGRGAG